MYNIENINDVLKSNDFLDEFKILYSNNQEILKQQQDRYLNAVNEFKLIFPQHKKVSFFSAPGRTEIGGNHTDHQHGIVLAASVNLDVIAIVALNDSNIIRVQSKGFPMDTIDINNLDIVKEETGKSASIIRGIVSRFNQLGYKIGGFDAYTTSNVLKGSGLSSSAAFENLIGTILNCEFNNCKLSAIEIAIISQYAENVYFGKACGLMDQMASSVGGFSSMDFKDPENPIIEKIDFDFTNSGYSLCVVDTKGNHADLTPDYVAIPTEMKAVANVFSKEVLRQVDEQEFYKNIDKVRQQTSDRAVMRAIHFFNDNKNALEEAVALKNNNFEEFKRLIKSSGNSSFKFLQNIFSCSSPLEQGVGVGLAVSEKILGDKGVCRVHGGGFAGTIQAFVPVDFVNTYKETIENVFGAGSCYVLNIRNIGGTKIGE